MSNRIRRRVLQNFRLTPAEATLQLAIYPERLTSSTDIKGRLMGPRSYDRETIEVAYPWRVMARQDDHLIVRVVVPEPIFWDPASPFLYVGPIELWQDSVKVDVVPERLACRCLQRSCHLNGELLSLRGTSKHPTTETEALELHRQGYNLLLTSSPDEVMELADKFGFLVLTKSSPDHVRLGWESQTLLGTSDATNTKGAAFLLCEEADLPRLIGIEIAKIVLVDHLPTETKPGIIGWVERSKTSFTQ